MARLLLGMAAALLAGGCAAPVEMSDAERDRAHREYRTGTNFPRGRDSGVQTFSREAVEAAQQSGPPGGYTSPHAGGAR